MTFEKLENEITIEQQEIAICIDNIVRYRQRLEQSVEPFEQEILTKALGAELQSFYTGAERIFEKIAKNVDRTSQSKSANWHKSLLDRMVKELPEVRDPVISSQTWKILDELRRFRHVIRSNYLHQLKTNLILDLALKTSDCYLLLVEDLSVFTLFLSNETEEKSVDINVVSDRNIKTDVRASIQFVKQRIEGNDVSRLESAEKAPEES